MDTINFGFGFFVDEKEVFAFFGTNKIAGLNFLSVGDKKGVGGTGEQMSRETPWAGFTLSSDEVGTDRLVVFCLM